MQCVLGRSQGRKSNLSLLKFQASNEINCKWIVSKEQESCTSQVCRDKSILKRLKEIEDKAKKDVLLREWWEKKGRTMNSIFSILTFLLT